MEQSENSTSNFFSMSKIKVGDRAGSTASVGDKLLDMTWESPDCVCSSNCNGQNVIHPADKLCLQKLLSNMHNVDPNR